MFILSFETKGSMINIFVSFVGHCMRLVYFVSPYDLLDPVNKVIRTVTDSVSVGHSVTVCMEGSSAHKLQTAPLVTINRTGKM